ncbi:MAG TPA: dephospho-CoA kinase [Burkholderiaceae bacterium]|nr:dephospho-CoA kinase [Burkholderiaceae bacterium]
MADAPPARPPVVGITGGIGSGKSTVADLLVARGAALVDTDRIAHELTAPGGDAIAPIRAAFGDGAIAADGRMDRAAMRALAFSDPDARRRLEAILHPMIRERTQRGIDAAARAGAPYVLVAVPLLVESGDWRGRYDRVLVVDCPPEVQVARVMARSGLAREQVEAILAAQASRAQRLAAADDVIDNGGPRQALAAQVDALHETYLGLSRSGD